MAKYEQYAEHRDSGVESTPKMPSHWIAGKVKYVTESLNSVRVPLSSEERGSKKGEYPYYGASGIIDYVDDYLFDEETILFGEDGANLISRSTPLAFLANGKYWVNNHAHILRTKDGVNDYWVMCFESIDVTSVISGSAQPKLTAEALGNLQVVYPPTIVEREEIANFLDHETAQIDTLIKKQQTLIKLLKEKRQAVISHAVTKGLNPNSPMKDSGVEWLGEVPEHWVVSKLKYLISEPLQYGANEAAEDIDPTQPRFVRITDVLPNGDLKNDTFRSLPEDIAEPYMLKDGDVLLARSGGTVGKSFIYRDSWGKCCFAGYLIKAKIDEDITPAEWFYLNTLTDFYWKWIESIQIQATIQNVSADKYNSFVIAVPPLEESYKIISYIKSNLKVFDTLVMKAESAIQLMQERRTALISAAVTGKIDVRGWVAPE